MEMKLFAEEAPPALQDRMRVLVIRDLMRGHNPEPVRTAAQDLWNAMNLDDVWHEPEVSAQGGRRCEFEVGGDHFCGLLPEEHEIYEAML